MFPLLAQATTSSFSRTIDTIARTPLSKIVILALICTVVRLLIYPYLKNVPIHKREAMYIGLRFFNEALDALVYAAVFVFLIIRPFMLQMFTIPSESMVDTLQINDFIVANKAIYRYTEPKVGDIIVFRPPLGAVDDSKMLDSEGRVNQDFIKRCVGVPGDIVEVHDGSLWRNGKQIKESYLKDSPFDGAYKLVEYNGPNAHFAEQKWIPVVTTDSSFTQDCDINHGESHPGKLYAIGVGENRTEGGIERRLFVDRAQLSEDEIQLQNALRDAKPIPIPKGYYLMMGDNRNGSYDGRFWGLIPKSAIVGRAEFIVFPFRRATKLR